jgi:SNF2-related domain
MGLGKTLQSISILVYMMEYKQVNGPHLIVVPKSTLSNWMNELARWAPTLNPVKFHGDKATREDIISTILEPGQRDEDRDWHVVVTTYEICNLEKNTLKKFAWSYLIIDEVCMRVCSICWVSQCSRNSLLLFMRTGAPPQERSLDLLSNGPSIRDALQNLADR